MRSAHAGVKYLHLGWDLQAFRARDDLTLGAWLRSLRGVRSHAFFDLGDPGPLVGYLTATLRDAGTARWRAQRDATPAAWFT